MYYSYILFSLPGHDAYILVLPNTNYTAASHWQLPYDVSPPITAPLLHRLMNGVSCNRVSLRNGC